MLFNIVEIFKKFFSNESLQDTLDAYISAGKPQNAGDVDRLEREYFEKARRASSFHFHE